MAQGTDISSVLNVIRATASDAYQTTVPLATASNIADVGEAVLNAPTAIRNEFMSNLYNKIGLTLIDSPVVENQFSFLKKGRLEYGQTIRGVNQASSEMGQTLGVLQDSAARVRQTSCKLQHLVGQFKVSLDAA